MAPVYRCYCPSKGYSTTAIGLECKGVEIGCAGPNDIQELLGYVATSNKGGYSPVKQAKLSNGSTGYCFGDNSGCIFTNVCLGSTITNFWSY
jgi:hypothetical protein